MRKINCVFALLLALMLLLSACADGAGASTSVYTAATPGTRATRVTRVTRPRVTTAEVKFPTTHINENTNFRGEVFTFALLTDCEDVSGYGICEAEDGAESINKAVKERDELLYDVYNAKTETVKTSAAALASELDAGSCTADFVYAPQGAVSTAYCRDISTMEIEFNDKPWWFTQLMTVDGKCCAVSGSFSLEMLGSAECILFNKDVKAQIPTLGDVDFYAMIDGRYTWEWTLDKLLELSRAAGEAGKIGFVSESDGPSVLYFGAGQSFLSKKDTKDTGALKHTKTTFEHGFNETAKEITDKIVAVFGYSSVRIGTEAEIFDAFKKGDALFTIATIGDFEKYRDEKINCGILPLPFGKFDEGGITCISPDTPFLFVLERGASQEYTECFLWYYAYYSYYTVYKEFYYTNGDIFADVQQYYVDYIVNSLTYDFAYSNGWHDVSEQYSSAVLAGENPIERFGAELGGELEALVNEAYGKSPKP